MSILTVPLSPRNISLRDQEERLCGSENRNNYYIL
jgi:hypothetical protein